MNEMTARALIAGAVLAVVFLVNAATLGLVRASNLHLAERVAANEVAVRELSDGTRGTALEGADARARTVADR